MFMDPIWRFDLLKRCIIMKIKVCNKVGENNRNNKKKLKLYFFSPLQYVSNLCCCSSFLQAHIMMFFHYHLSNHVPMVSLFRVTKTSFPLPKSWKHSLNNYSPNQLYLKSQLTPIDFILTILSVNIDWEITLPWHWCAKKKKVKKKYSIKKIKAVSTSQNLFWWHSTFNLQNKKINSDLYSVDCISYLLIIKKI